MEQQLAAALAACKLKDDIISSALKDFPARQKAAMKEAIAVEPTDLSGLILCHAESRLTKFQCIALRLRNNSPTVRSAR